MPEVTPQAAIASVTLTDQLARMLVHKGVFTHRDRGMVVKNAVSFLRSGLEIRLREAAELLERFWEQGWVDDAST